MHHVRGLVAAPAHAAEGRGTGCRSPRGSGRPGPARPPRGAPPPSGTSRSRRTRRSTRARARGSSSVGLREAVEDDRPAERRERRRGLRARRAAVDHDRQAELVCEREVRLEERALLAQRVGAVVAVEPGLADGDDARVARGARRARRPAPPPASRPDAGRSRAPRRRPSLRLGDRERAPARVDSRPDRHDARHPGRRARGRAARPGRRRTRRGARACRSRGRRRLVDAREERLPRARGPRPARVRP